MSVPAISAGSRRWFRTAGGRSWPNAVSTASVGVLNQQFEVLWSAPGPVGHEPAVHRQVVAVGVTVARSNDHRIAVVDGRNTGRAATFCEVLERPAGVVEERGDVPRSWSHSRKSP